MEIENGFRVHIDSHNKLHTTDTYSDFHYEIDVPDTLNADRVCLLDAVIPRSDYVIQSGYSSFILTELSQSVTIVFPPGNYSRTSFQYVLQNLLNDNSINGWIYAISWPNKRIEADTGLFTFTVSGNSGQPSISFVDTDIHTQFGFDRNSVNTFVNNTLTSTAVIKMTPQAVILLKSDIAMNKSNNILQHFFIPNVADYDTYVYKCNNVSANSLPLSNSTNIYHFYLCGEDGTPIDLRGRNFNFVLLIYKKNGIWEMIRDSLNLYGRSSAIWDKIKTAVESVADSMKELLSRIKPQTKL